MHLKKILIVDDIEYFRSEVKEIVQTFSFVKIDEAINGEDALIKIKESRQLNEPYHLIISDINMPKMNGHELLIKLREVDKNCHFLMVSTESEHELIIKSLLYGLNDFVVKPFLIEEFKKKVALLLI